MTAATVAFDAMLLEKLTHCSLCGRPGVVHGGIWTVEPWLVVHGALCRRCYRQGDAVHTPAIEALLRRRYGCAAD